MNSQESFIVSSARRWFGHGRKAGADDADHDDIDTGVAIGTSRAALAREQLLTAISEFFVAHDIHLDARRLALVHDMLAGKDQWLGSRYAKRRQSGLIVNNQWLEQLDLDYSRQARSQFDQLMTEFQDQISQFAQSAKETRLAAEGYESELSQTVDGALAQPTSPEALAMLAQRMIDQTRGIALAMKTSEQHTQGLQRRLEKAKIASETDVLTGLPNRRAFEDRFQTAIHSAQSGSHRLCVAFCDIDNFKQVNDQHGHDAGDRVLKKVAGELGTLASPLNFVSRHGGEEFAVLFEKIALADAIARLDAVRTRLAATQLRDAGTGASIGHMTFSAGVVDVMTFADPRDALWAADKAMYLAKKSGKNQVLQGAAG
jgi:diguanylate cyclase